MKKTCDTCIHKEECKLQKVMKRRDYNRDTHDMTERMMDFFAQYPLIWVVEAFEEAYKKAKQYHVELDALGKVIWVRDEEEVSRWTK